MKRHACPLALALVIGLSGVVPVRAAEPTPTPQPKAKRKLGGGSFGQPPTTPTPATGGSSLADAARKAQEEGGAGTQARSARVVITNETLKKPERATGTGTGISISGSAGAKPSVRIPATPGPTPQALIERVSQDLLRDLDAIQILGAVQIDQHQVGPACPDLMERFLEGPGHAADTIACAQQAIRPMFPDLGLTGHDQDATFRHCLPPMTTCNDSSVEIGGDRGPEQRSKAVTAQSRGSKATGRYYNKDSPTWQLRAVAFAQLILLCLAG